MSKREPTCFLTADTALVVGNEVLLVKRRNEPFRGMWCLPGGFIDADEKVLDGCLRELREETSVTGVLLEFFGAYGDPGRDPRGRTVTFMYWARLDSKPEAKAGDDAAEFNWFDLYNPPAMAFDHGQMLADIRARLAAITGKK